MEMKREMVPAACVAEYQQPHQGYDGNYMRCGSAASVGVQVLCLKLFSQGREGGAGGDAI